MARGCPWWRPLTAFVFIAVTICGTSFALPTRDHLTRGAAGIGSQSPTNQERNDFFNTLMASSGFAGHLASSSDHGTSSNAIPENVPKEETVEEVVEQPDSSNSDDFVETRWSSKSKKSGRNRYHDRDDHRDRYDDHDDHYDDHHGGGHGYDKDEEDPFFKASVDCRFEVYPYAKDPEECSQIEQKNHEPDLIFDNPHKRHSRGACFWDFDLAKLEGGSNACLCPREEKGCKKAKQCYWFKYKKPDHSEEDLLKSDKHDGWGKKDKQGWGKKDKHDEEKEDLGVCMHNSERFYNLMARLLAKRGKKDFALNIKYNSAPARGKLPYGPHGPAIVGFGEDVGKHLDKLYPDESYNYQFDDKFDPYLWLGYKHPKPGHHDRKGHKKHGYGYGHGYGRGDLYYGHFGREDYGYGKHHGRHGDDHHGYKEDHHDHGYDDDHYGHGDDHYGHNDDYYGHDDNHYGYEDDHYGHDDDHYGYEDDHHGYEDDHHKHDDHYGYEDPYGPWGRHGRHRYGYGGYGYGRRGFGYGGHGFGYGRRGLGYGGYGFGHGGYGGFSGFVGSGLHNHPFALHNQWLNGYQAPASVNYGSGSATAYQVPTGTNAYQVPTATNSYQAPEYQLPTAQAAPVAEPTYPVTEEVAEDYQPVQPWAVVEPAPEAGEQYPEPEPVQYPAGPSQPQESYAPVQQPNPTYAPPQAQRYQHSVPALPYGTGYTMPGQMYGGNPAYQNPPQQYDLNTQGLHYPYPAVSGQAGPLWQPPTGPYMAHSHVPAPAVGGPAHAGQYAPAHVDQRVADIEEPYSESL